MTVAVDGWKNRRQKRDRIRCGVHHIALVTSGALVISFNMTVILPDCSLENSPGMRARPSP